MRKSRCSKTRIVEVLKEEEAGIPVAEILRKHGMIRATYENWKSEYADATVAELKRMREWCAPGSPDSRRGPSGCRQQSTTSDALRGMPFYDEGRPEADHATLARDLAPGEEDLAGSIGGTIPVGISGATQ